MTQTALLKIDDLAERWQINWRTVLRMVDRKELRAIKIGAQLRFSMAEVERYERERDARCKTSH